MDKTTKRKLGINPEEGKRGKNFKTVADTIDRDAGYKAVKDLIKRVKTGDPVAVKEFLDRYFGKPKEAVELSNPDGTLKPTQPIVVQDEETRKIMEQALNGALKR